MCLAASYWARIDKIFFAAGRADAAAIGFDDSHFYEQLALPLDKRGLPMEQALQAEAKAMMARWLAQPNRIPY